MANIKDLLSWLGLLSLRLAGLDEVELTTFRQLKLQVADLALSAAAEIAARQEFSPPISLFLECPSFHPLPLFGANGRKNPDWMTSNRALICSRSSLYQQLVHWVLADIRAYLF